MPLLVFWLFGEGCRQKSNRQIIEDLKKQGAIMSVYTNEKSQQILMWDLESTVNVREFSQSTIMKTSDTFQLPFFISSVDEHLIFHVGMSVRSQKAFQLCA